MSGAAESDCADGVDNDENGATDCDDDLCALSHECSLESCFNGADDDKDGDIDCADSECSESCDESLNCDDGQDNDQDGQTDCDDADCGGTVACLPEICDDAIDNDEDGKLDCEDPECVGTVVCKAAGDICDKPIVINELPYEKTLSTCDFEDTLKSQAGGGCFIGGENLPENIYAYTASESMTVVFEIVPGDGDPNLMLNIATECQPTVNECIGGDNPLGDDPSATVEVQKSETYYVIIDGFSGPALMRLVHTDVTHSKRPASAPTASIMTKMVTWTVMTASAPMNPSAAASQTQIVQTKTHVPSACATLIQEHVPTPPSTAMMTMCAPTTVAMSTKVDARTLLWCVTMASTAPPISVSRDWAVGLH